MIRSLETYGTRDVLCAASYIWGGLRSAPGRYLWFHQHQASRDLMWVDVDGGAMLFAPAMSARAASVLSAWFAGPGRREPLRDDHWICAPTYAPSATTQRQTLAPSVHLACG